MSCFYDLYNSVMLDFIPQRQHIYEYILIEENLTGKNVISVGANVQKSYFNLYNYF